MTLNDLIAKYNGRSVAYKDLPHECQMAIVQYVSLNGTAWPIPEKFETQLNKLYQEKKEKEADLRRIERKIEICFRKNLDHYIKEYGKTKFGYIERLPLTDAKALCMNAFEKDEVPHTWDEYHKWYVGLGLTHVAGSNLWPVILSSIDNEFIEDGWNRFHRYAQRNLTYFPAIYFVKDDPIVFPGEIISEKQVTKQNSEVK